jgi:hypothetical protein
MSAYALALFWTDALVTFLVLAYGQLVQKYVFILQIDSIWVVLILFSLYNPLFLLYLAYNFQYAKRWSYDSVVIMFLIVCLVAFGCQITEALTALKSVGISNPLLILLSYWMPFSYLVLGTILEFLPVHYAGDANFTTTGAFIV